MTLQLITPNYIASAPIFNSINLLFISFKNRSSIPTNKQIFFSTDQIKPLLHLCSLIKVTSDHTFICRLHQNSIVNTSTINPPTTAFNYPHLPCQLRLLSNPYISTIKPLHLNNKTKSPARCCRSHIGDRIIYR
ncbi:hypothetical protein Hanom_Chr04g00372731 [Helianthus anomalus]